MQITIKGTNSENFVEELLAKITDVGFNSMSKNDFYDYVLYLLDEHSEESFLSTRSNFENALYFKVTEQKIKNSKLNINLKYRQNDSLTIITMFLANLNLERIKKTNEGNFEFVIEDYYTRMCLENELKKIGDTLNYKNNTEKVEISKESLFELLKSYNEELRKKLKKQEILTSLYDVISKYTGDLDTHLELFKNLKNIGCDILKIQKENKV